MKNAVRINKVKIENFKKIDSLELEFPKPKMPSDLDVTVLGSKNGLGKSTIIDLCSEVFLDVLFKKLIYFDKSVRIKVGKTNSFLEFNIGFRDENYVIKYGISKEKTVLSGDMYNLNKDLKKFLNYDDNKYEKPLSFLKNYPSDPLIIPGLLMEFDDSRRIERLNPSLSKLNETEKVYKPSKIDVSLIKNEITKCIMAKHGLFGNIDYEDSNNAYYKLNELLKEYASVELAKFNSLPDGEIELMVSPVGAKEYYPFDNLSSGQLEIVTMLFLIWKHTAQNPSIVLIDEPEQHLNPEWQRKFIHTLKKIAPHNQYILATHSEHIFESVEKYQRILLEEEFSGG